MCGTAPEFEKMDDDTLYRWISDNGGWEEFDAPTEPDESDTNYGDLALEYRGELESIALETLEML